MKKLLFLFYYLFYLMFRLLKKIEPKSESYSDSRKAHTIITILSLFISTNLMILVKGNLNDISIYIYMGFSYIILYLLFMYKKKYAKIYESLNISQYNKHNILGYLFLLTYFIGSLLLISTVT